MSIFNLLGINSAYAATSSVQDAGGNFLHSLPLLVLVIAAFYFMIIRPQSKRSKEARELISSLSVNDEVATIGGIVGKVVKISDDFVVLTISGDTQLTLQKRAIAKILPKGTLQTAV